jgi:hypothetical protein
MLVKIPKALHNGLTEKEGNNSWNQTQFIGEYVYEKSTGRSHFEIRTMNGERFDLEWIACTALK